MKMVACKSADCLVTKRTKLAIAAQVTRISQESSDRKEAL